MLGHGVFFAACGLSLVVASAQAVGWLQALIALAFLVAEHEHPGFSSLWHTGLAPPQHVWDLPQSRDQTYVPCTFNRERILIPWTTKENPLTPFNSSWLYYGTVHLPHVECQAPLYDPACLLTPNPLYLVQSYSYFIIFAPRNCQPLPLSLSSGPLCYLLPGTSPNSFLITTTHHSDLPWIPLPLRSVILRQGCFVLRGLCLETFWSQLYWRGYVNDI